MISHRYILKWIDPNTVTLTYIIERPHFYYFFNVPTPIGPKLGINSVVYLKDIIDVGYESREYYSSPYVKYKISYNKADVHYFPQIYIPDRTYQENFSKLKSFLRL